MRKFTFIAALAAALVSPTAGAQDAAAAAAVQDRYFERIEQVATTSWPLLVNGADLCQVDTAFRTGVRTAYLSGDPAGNDGARISAVAKGSPADAAGIKRGDAVVAINGEKVEGLIPGRGDGRLTKLIDGAAESADAVTFELLRDGKPVVASVRPVEVCDLKVEYVPVQSMITPRSGDTVIVSDLLFNVADTEWKRQAFLASDIAYAMSHATTRNNLIKKVTGAGGNFLASVSGLNGLASAVNLGTSIGLNKGQALKADRVSLFLLARSGVDVAQVPEFWRSVYAYPESAAWSKTYFGLRPTLAERNAAFDSALAEIQDLKARGLPITPSDT